MIVHIPLWVREEPDKSKLRPQSNGLAGIIYLCIVSGREKVM